MAIATDEPLIGVVCSDGLRRGDDGGYALIVTRHRVIGAKRPESLQNYAAYLAKDAPQATRSAALSLANALLPGKQFEVRTGAIGQVLYRRPTLLSGGYAIIKTGDDTIKVETSVFYTHPDIADASNVLARAFRDAVGWRFVEESLLGVVERQE